MRFAFYCAVLVVALAGVVLGLDFMPAPMPPMPDVKNIVFVPPPAPSPRVETAASPPVAVAPAMPTPATAAPSGLPVASAPAATPPVAVEAKRLAAAIVAAPPRPKCDVDACAGAYVSFRDSDCTYNPSFGPRRLCTKGNPEKYAAEHPAVSSTPPGETLAPAAEPGAIVGEEQGAAAKPAATAPPGCNVSACRAAYPRSFHEADCTFNPASGPRKLCEK
jgi:hypothetical protein